MEGKNEYIHSKDIESKIHDKSLQFQLPNYSPKVIYGRKE